jgi:hypothetical protein
MSFIELFIHSFTHSFIHQLTHTFIYLVSITNSSIQGYFIFYNLERNQLKQKGGHHSSTPPLVHSCNVHSCEVYIFTMR